MSCLWSILVERTEKWSAWTWKFMQIEIVVVFQGVILDRILNYGI